MAKINTSTGLLRLLGGLFAVALLSTSAWAGKSAELSRFLTAEDTRHFLSRTGIGVAPSDVLNYRNLTRQEAIDRLMAGFRQEPDLPMPAWVDAPVPHYHARQDMDDDERVRFNNERDAEVSQLRQWWIITLLDTASPQSERMVLFWHDLFATSYYDTDRQSIAMARQNQTFRRLGMGSWETLLKAMIRDPALLEFLDSGSNHKDSPNENLARELLELFVLGEGNYSENDIKEAARSLTGHDTSRIHNLAFRRKSWVQDRDEKTLFGVRGKHDGDALVELALDQPAAARFLVSRFWLAFVSDSAPDQHWVTRLAERFQDSSYNLSQLYRDVLESEAFWQTQYRGSIIKSPVDLIAGTARTLEYPKSHWRQMARWQAELGMDLFAPPNVSGWREAAAFITPGRLLNRHRLVSRLIADSDASSQPDQDMSGNSVASSTMQSLQSGMQTMQSMQNGMQQKVSDLQIRMAAEDYRGAVVYKVSLHNDQSLLWSSDERIFTGGHDTEMYGRIANQSELSWQEEHINAPFDAVENSSSVTITFLNDAAGPGGDRNLYIDGVLIGDQWLPGNRAIQRSECTPELAANAWKLYCAGSIKFTRGTDQSGDLQPLPAWRAAAAHVQWANQERNSEALTVYFTLDHLVTPHRRFHTLQFSVHTFQDKPAQLRLETYGCWPGCFMAWPQCAWVDEHFPAAKTLSFAWLDASDDQYDSDAACHSDDITQAERDLVATLWRSLPSIVDQLKTSNRGQQYFRQLDKTGVRIAAQQPSIANTPYAGHGGTIELAAAFAPPRVRRQSLSNRVPLVQDTDTLLKQLSAGNIQLDDLLVPELTIAGLPGLSMDENTGAIDQLKAITKHPLFQVK